MVDFFNIMIMRAHHWIHFDGDGDSGVTEASVALRKNTETVTEASVAIFTHCKKVLSSAAEHLKHKSKM